MNIGDNIRKIRIAKKLSQKEVILNAGLDTAQYSRIENNRTEPSLTTLEKITKALGVSFSELFAISEDNLYLKDADIKTVIGKVALIETLPEEESKAIYTLLDALITKKKLKDALSNALQDTK